jgi:uncharacterized protein (TIGR03437 family)
MLTRTLAPGFASAGKPGYPNRQKASRCGCVRGAVFLAAVSIAVAAAGHAQTFGMLYNFSGAADGANPGPLVQGPDGNFYGTNGGGGANGFGTVFKITPAGSLTTLHSFSGAEGSTASVSPIGGLALGNDGNFYGTTGSTFFRITPAGTLTTLYTFEAAAGEPQWLLLGADGNFYGTAAGGTSGIFGAVFKITPAGSFTNLFTFSPAGDNPCGINPQATLARGTDGNFYGTTACGGAGGVGTVFKITPEGSLTILHSFGGAGGPFASLDSMDGAYPLGALALGNDGNFYGTTRDAGPQGTGWGTVFRITPTGTLTTIYSFGQGGFGDGAYPEAGLTLGADGNFYGDSFGGGVFGGGTLFKITPGGTLTTLYSFDVDFQGPECTLTLGSDGSFYGTTPGSGSPGDGGTVFKLSVGSGTGTLSINANGVVNAASYSAPVAAGSIAAVFGIFPIGSPASATSLPLPIDISGVALEFPGAGLNAPLFYGSMLQINAQIPWELAGESQTIATASLAGDPSAPPSAPQTLTLAAYAPGIFVVNGQTGQGAILDANYQLVSATNPAAAGAYVQIYCTGLGSVTNQPATGTPALSDPLSITKATPTVTIGNVPAIKASLRPMNVPRWART